MPYLSLRASSKGSADDQALLTPLHHFATTLTKKANPQSGKMLSVFVCQFNCIPKTLLQDFEFLGVIHTGEIPYVFNIASLWSYDEQSVDAKTAEVVGSLWANFAKTGNPGKTLQLMVTLSLAL